MSIVSKLDCLTSDETAQYLERCGITQDNYERAYRVTHGHPLALALASQILRQNPNAVLPPDNSKEYLTILLKQFTHNIPSFQHRLTLWLCSVVPYASQDLIRKIIDEEKSAALLDWLGDLSFAGKTLQGVAIHELVSEVLRADLSWRDPELYHFLLNETAKHQLDHQNNFASKKAAETRASTLRSQLPSLNNPTEPCTFSTSFVVPYSENPDTGEITRHEFEHEIKKALKNYHHPDRLKNSILLNCSFAKTRFARKDNWLQKSEKLVTELFNQACTFKNRPSQKVFFNVLQATYFDPSTKQRVAAEKLCMSFGTYRRRLWGAIKHLTDRLWLLESSFDEHPYRNLSI